MRQLDYVDLLKEHGGSIQAWGSRTSLAERAMLERLNENH